MSYSSFLSDMEKQKGVHIKVKGVVSKPALVNYFLDGKTIYQTIEENQQLIDYQIIVKRSSKSIYADAATGEELRDKVLRLFPVTEGGKHYVKHNGDSIPDVPEQTILVKENIQQMTIQQIPNLDINYYINKFQSDLKTWLEGGASTDDSDDVESYEDNDDD